MTTYTIRRILLIIPTIFIVSLIVFASVRLMPGDIVDLLIADAGASGDVRESIERTLGLDVPAHVQYFRWMKGIFTEGDLGKSLVTFGSVNPIIFPRIAVTFELGLIALIISLLVGVPIGIYSAIQQDTLGDYLGRGFAIGAVSIPHFWLGAMVMLYPAIYWGWAPPVVYIPFTQDPLGNIGMLLIPAAIIAMTIAGQVMRMTRTMMLEVLRQDYIRTAWSKGLKERVVIMRHALKNALIPVVTLIGLAVPWLISGSLVIEQIFVIPGLGRLMLSALNDRDYTTVSALNLVVAVAVVLVNVIVDLTYSWLDPRVQLMKEGKR